MNDNRHTIRINIKTLEYILGYAGLVWGFIVLLPDLDTYGTTSAYKVFQRAGVPEWALGGVVFCVSLVRLLSVWAGWTPGRLFAAFVGCFEWGIFAIVIVANNVAAPGWAIYWVPAVLSVVTLGKLSARFFEVRRARK